MARREPADEQAAHELVLTINNDRATGRGSRTRVSIEGMLEKRMWNGTYDHALAPKAYSWLVEEGARNYQNEFGPGNRFAPATRDLAAAELAEDFFRNDELFEVKSDASKARGQVLEDAIQQIGRPKYTTVGFASAHRGFYLTVKDSRSTVARVRVMDDGSVLVADERDPGIFEKIVAAAGLLDHVRTERA